MLHGRGHHLYTKQALVFEKFFTNLTMLELMLSTTQQGTNLPLTSSLKKNQRYEVYKFRQTRQEEGETLDKFHTRLRNLSSNCEFTNADFEIEQQILTGGSSSKIRRRALRDPDYKLKDMLIDGRRDEMSSYQAKDIESKEKTVAETNRMETKKVSKCYSCGRAYPHTGPCPAQGKECNHCLLGRRVRSTIVQNK